MLQTLFQKYKAQLALLGAALCYTSLVLSSRLLTEQSINLFNQVFWRLVFGICFAAFFAFGIFTEKLSLSSKELKYLLINSLIFLGGFTTFSGAIYLGTPLAKAVALNYAYPLIVILLAYGLLKETPSLKQWISVLLSVFSVLVLIEFWKIKGFNFFSQQSTSQPTSFQIGDLVAFANSWFYGAIIVFGRKLRIETGLNHFKALFYSHLFMLPFLFLLSFLLSLGGISLLEPKWSLSYSATTWLVLIGSAIFGGIIPIYLIYYGVSKLKPFIASVFLLTEPLWVYFFAWLFFGQTLSGWGIIGSIGIIFSVLLI